MIRQWWPVIVPLAAALAIAVPTRAERRRARVLGTRSGRYRWVEKARSQVGGRTPDSAATARTVGRSAPVLAGWSGVPGMLGRLMLGRFSALALAVSAGGAALAFGGGPVAAFAAGTYTALVTRGLRRHHLLRLRSRRRVQTLDALCGLAAELRTGLPATVLSPLLPNTSDGGRLASLALAAVRVAETTGAPLAELVERIEADARAADRMAARAVAQAAGVRATAVLLAVLPAGGIALGYGVGVDPMRVLLQTPVGACCAVTAVLLQVGGLAWADRLARLPGGTW